MDRMKKMDRMEMGRASGRGISSILFILQILFIHEEHVQPVDKHCLRGNAQ